MSIILSFMEGLGPLVSPEAAAHDPSAIPTIKMVLVGDVIERPVDVVRLLSKQGGMSLKEAHASLDRLAADKKVVVHVRTNALATLVSGLSRLGVTAYSNITDPVTVLVAAE